MSQTSKPAVFFDRDNTLIVADGFLGDPGGVTLVEGAAAAVARARRLGYAVVVISNQSGVARGLFDENAVHAVNARMGELLRESEVDAEIDRHEFCPFHPDAVVEAYRQDSDLRKPKPGMLFRVAAELDLDLQRSWLVGDAPRDVEAGRLAGTRTILLRQPDLAPSPAASATNFDPPDFEAWSLKQAMDIIEAQNTSAEHSNGVMAMPPAEEAPIAPADESVAEIEDEAAPETDMTDEAQAVFAPEAEVDGEEDPEASAELPDEVPAEEAPLDELPAEEPIETVESAPTPDLPAEEPAPAEPHWPVDTSSEPPAETAAEMTEPPVAADPPTPPSKLFEAEPPAPTPAPSIRAASYSGAAQVEDENAPVGLTFPSLRPPANLTTSEGALMETKRGVPADSAATTRPAEEPAVTVTNSSLVGKAATLAVLQAAAAKKSGRKASRAVETPEEETPAPTPRKERSAETFSSGGDRLENLMEQVLTELRRRNDQGPADFSVPKMLAGVVQIMAVVPLVHAYQNWGAPAASAALLVAIFLQTLTITLYIMTRK